MDQPASPPAAAPPEKAPAAAAPPSNELDARNVFRLAVDECWRDGRLDEPEAEFLKRLARLLGVAGAEAEAVGQAASAKAGGPKTVDEPLDRERILRAACRLAWRDKALQATEAQLLRTLAHLLQIEAFRVDRVLEEERLASGGAAKPKSAGADPEEDEVPEGRPTPKDPLMFGVIMAAFVPIFVLPVWLVVDRAGKLGPSRAAGPWRWVLYAEVGVAALTILAWILFRMLGSGKSPARGR